MTKNNIKSFLIHVIITIFSVIIFTAFNSVQVKWASEEAARYHHYYMMFAAFSVIAVAVILYYISGRIFLTNQGSIWRNIISASLTAVIGMLLWMFAYNIAPAGPGKSLLNSELWQFYSIYNGYSLFLLNESGTNNPNLFLLFSLIPSTVMGMGARKKKRKS